MMALLCLKSLFLFILIACFCTDLSAQADQWTWMKGDNSPFISGVYGTKGVAATTNKPGSRRLSISWTDKAGNFWLFGGNGYDLQGNLGYLNDLWKYDVSTNNWTWIKGDSIADRPGVYGTAGVSSPANKPGGRRRSVAWTDTSGNLWLFGGNGYASTVSSSGYLSDLWKYNIATNEWTWVKGDNTADNSGVYGTKNTPSAANKPGARYGAVSWADTQGFLWLFGGLATVSESQAELNDLWKYNISTNMWTWVSGSNAANASGTYGTKGVSSASNTPGAREYAVTWTNGSDNLFLFGGSGLAVAGEDGYLNDLWRFNTTTNHWTWIKGNNVANADASYGSKGVSSETNTPGAREYSCKWADAMGNLWLFGGDGYATGSAGYLNDLWKYDNTTNQWTWIKGNNSVNLTGVYGTKGVSSSTNNPGAREYGVSWTDHAGNFWLFGGDAYYAIDQSDYLNDLWKYTTQAPCIPNTWTGAISTDWNNPANWSCNTLPAQGANVVIPSTTNKPLINTAITVGNLNLNGEFNLNGQSLTITGAVTGTGTITGSPTSDIVVTGNAGVLNFTAGAAVLHSLTVNPGASATINTTVTIVGH